MSAVRSASLALVLSLLAAAGCGAGRLNVEKKYTPLEVGETKAIDLDPQSKAQTIKVEFTSNPARVTVYLIKSEGKESELKETPSKEITLGKESGKEGKFQVEVPANTRIRVLVTEGATTTDVTVKLSNAQ
jgi:hypothetical protein